MSVVTQPTHIERAGARLSHDEWLDLRKRLVQNVRSTDGRFEYTFRCQTPVEVWRAQTMAVKEAGTVRWIDAEVHAAQVFYDIGANIGLYTLMAGKRVGERGTVYAFEPHVSNVESLLHNVSMNGLAANVRVLSCALNDREGFFDFNYFQPAAGTSMSQLGDTRDAAGETFAPCFAEYKYATTIDRLIQAGQIRPADHVKIDVDGNELLVLRGMREYLAGPRAPRSLQVEINTRYKDELYALLRAAGFTHVERHDTDHGKKALARGEDPESIGYNAIFRRPAAGSSS